MEELISWLAALFALLMAIVFGVEGLVWLYNHERHYIITGAIIIGVILLALLCIFILAIFLVATFTRPKKTTRIPENRVEPNTLPEKARDAEVALREARRNLEREAASIERLRLEKQGELHFQEFHRRHYESFTIADRWREITRGTRVIRRSTSDGLTKLRENKRRLAKERDSTPHTRRANIESELRQTQRVIDQLYGALASLDQEIERGRRELTAYNVQTGKLRDHIRDNCGAKGRQWYARLEARKRERYDD